MNLLPSVEAYCRERVAQLEQQEPRPVDSIRELHMVLTLCHGLGQQMPVFDALVKQATTPKGT